ncbi:MFS family multidrug transport protein [Klebsiella pneumoniae]|uniref:MFS family multidrug transport protein n=1 Tax=Klebsiella pneumoniae TaxID=573 RepID=A0A377XPM6_KLEPN|nr:MFS family multidrug transport protein [Klebsiella pneumoniae]
MATFTTAWPMLISIAFCATLLYFLLALRIPAAKNRTLGHIFRGEIAPFLMHVNRNGASGFCDLFPLCKIN